MKTTTKSAPLDYLQPDTEWSQFYDNLWGHDVFGIIFLACVAGAIIWAVIAENASPVTLYLIGIIAACVGGVWLLS